MQVSGSGPAYHYLAMEAMIDGAVQMGFNREVPLPPERAQNGFLRRIAHKSARIAVHKVAQGFLTGKQI